MALQHLRSSTANKRPTPAAMSDGQLAMNTNLASPGLFLKDSNGDLVKVGPVHVGTTAPNATPASGGQAGNSVGEQWLDTSSSRYVFKIWDGTAWRTEDGEFVNSSGDTMTGALGIIAGSASTPGLFFSGDANSGLYSPGADQVAVATNGTQRLTVDTAATTSTLPVVHPLGAVGTPSLTFTGDLNTGIWSPAADTIAFSEGGVEAMRIDSSGRVVIGTSTASGDALLQVAGDVLLSGTGYLDLPVGTTAERPGTPSSGMIRFNTTLTQFEGYNGSAWSSVGGGATGGGADTIFFENGQTVTTNYTLTTNKNAVTAGPVTVNSGVTVTIPSGSSWVVV